MEDESSNPEPTAPRPSWALIAASIPSIVLCLWVAGAIIAQGLTSGSLGVTLAACFSGLAGPGMIALQQYCGTFRASIAGARFSIWIFGIVAAFSLAAVFAALTSQVGTDGMRPDQWLILGIYITIMLVTAASSLLNYARWRQLLMAQSEGARVGFSLRFSLVEIMGILLAVGIVLGGASFVAHG